MECSNFLEQFDQEFDLVGLKEELKNVVTDVDYKEVPPGIYDVEVEKLELVKSKTGKPMLTCWMRIVYGEYENSMLFLNQVIDTAYGIHNANEVLRSLRSGLVVEFESFVQYHELVFTIYEAVVGAYEFVLVYGENHKGFKTFKITEAYRVD